MRYLLFVFLLCFLAPAFSKTPVASKFVKDFLMFGIYGSPYISDTNRGMLVQNSLVAITDRSESYMAYRKPLVSKRLMIRTDSSGTSSKAQQKVPVKRLLTLHIDSSHIVVKKFNGQALSGFSRQPEFKYDQSAPLTDGLWERFWKSFWKLISSIFFNGTSGTAFKYILLAALTGLVIFVILKIGGLEFNIFTGKSKTQELPYHESTENIHEINFEDEIQEAVEQANYRLAVRLLYLRSLKVLNDQRLIEWQPEKTNHTYVNEIMDGAQKEQFAILTREFEYIWYGDFSIEKVSFSEIRANFIQFNLLKS